MDPPWDRLGPGFYLAPGLCELSDFRSTMAFHVPWVSVRTHREQFLKSQGICLSLVHIYCSKGPQVPLGKNQKNIYHICLQWNCLVLTQETQSYLRSVGSVSVSCLRSRKYIGIMIFHFEGWMMAFCSPLLELFYIKVEKHARREGGGSGVQGDEHMYTRGRFMSMYSKTNTIL